MGLPMSLIIVSNCVTLFTCSFPKIKSFGRPFHSSPRCQVPFAEDQNSPAGVDLNLVKFSDARVSHGLMGNHGKAMQRCLQLVENQGAYTMGVALADFHEKWPPELV